MLTDKKYEVLYRKYRPKNFYELIGQKYIIDILKEQIVTSKIAHVYLFSGTRGTGKTSCARILSRAINCQNNNDNKPCNVCENCIKILNNKTTDICEIDAASNNGIDNIREIIDKVKYFPIELKKRIYIIDEIHMLSTGAFNALLKLLEEPPSHTVFILATTEITKIPLTVLSRCQNFNFKRISIDNITKQIINIAKSEKIKISTKVANMIANLSDGSMRDALSIMDTTNINNKINDKNIENIINKNLKYGLYELFEYIIQKNIPEIIKILNTYYINGIDMSYLLQNLFNIYKDILIIKYTNNIDDEFINNDNLIFLKKYSEIVERKIIINKLNIISKHIEIIDKSYNKKIVFELCILKLTI